MFKPGTVVRSTLHPDCFCEILQIKRNSRTGHYYKYRYHPYCQGIHEKYVGERGIAVFYPEHWIRVSVPEPEVDKEYEDMLV